MGASGLVEVSVVAAGQHEQRQVSVVTETPVVGRR